MKSFKAKSQRENFSFTEADLLQEFGDSKTLIERMKNSQYLT